MKLLAIDTSTNYLSLAVTDGGKVLGRFHKKADMSHSSLLMPAIDKLLKKMRLELKDIDGFAISIGPGSFTGLRIGVATVKGLAFSLEKKIIAVPTLDAIAHNVKNFCGIICPILDARKNKVYACLYSSDGKTINRISKYLLTSVNGLVSKLKKFKKGILFLGDAAGQILMRCPSITPVRRNVTGPTKFVRGDWHPRAEIIAKLGYEKARKKSFVIPEDLRPLYLYSQECDIKGI